MNVSVVEEAKRRENKNIKEKNEKNNLHIKFSLNHNRIPSPFFPLLSLSLSLSLSLLLFYISFLYSPQSRHEESLLFFSLHFLLKKKRS
jgi:hypothetical protein